MLAVVYRRVGKVVPVDSLFLLFILPARFALLFCFFFLLQNGQEKVNAVDATKYLAGRCSVIRLYLGGLPRVIHLVMPCWALVSGSP